MTTVQHPYTQHALVTGGSSGIGLAICHTLVAAGWEVVNFDTQPPPDATSGEFVRVDMGDRAALAEALRELTARRAITGLVNNGSVAVTNAVTGNWTNGTTTPAQILADVNTLLEAVWQSSGFARCPDELRLPPIQFSYLVSTLISSAGNISILEFLKNNSICNSINGRPLNIQPLKWLTGRGASGKNRMVAYTNDRNLVRFPLVPLQRTPLEYRGIHQLTTYFGRLGVVEVVYGETLGYVDGI